MTTASPTGQTRVQTKITVPDSQIMVNLLGAGDEILRLVERSLRSDVHVRGNEITITGVPADNALAERLFTELLELIEKGETLTTDAVRRTVGMLEQNTAERPAEVLTLNILSRRGRTIRPKTLGQKRYVDAITPSCSASAPRVPVRRTSRWPRPCRRSRPSRSTGSS
jgi:phosphate starvation-inducible PhoH-like protein